MKKFKVTEKGINFLLIFILGFLVGVAIKSEAQKRITIGFNDYLAPQYRQDIDLMSPIEPQVPSQNEAENVQDDNQQNEQPVTGESQQE